MQQVKTAVKQQGRRRLTVVAIAVVVIAIPVGIAWANSRMHVSNSQPVVLTSHTDTNQTAARINLTASGLQPQMLAVKEGKAVAWYNQTNAPATLTGLDSAGVTLPSKIGAGQSFSAIFSQVGSFSYKFGTQSGTINVTAD